MHKNEIRYLFDDELKEVFKECVKYLVERDILLPLSEDDIYQYIQSLDMDKAIKIEEFAKERQHHLKEVYNDARYK